MGAPEIDIEKLEASTRFASLIEEKNKLVSTFDYPMMIFLIIFFLTIFVSFK